MGSGFHSLLPITCNGCPGVVGLMIDVVRAEVYLYARREHVLEYIPCGDMPVTSSVSSGGTREKQKRLRAGYRCRFAAAAS